MIDEEKNTKTQEMYKIKGYLHFLYEGSKMTYEARDLSIYEVGIGMNEKRIYDLLPGMDFYYAVDHGCFIDYDGTLDCIFVDGYLSNLGLSHKGIHQGEFLVTGDVFKQLCEEHRIEVNWANK